MFAADPRIDLPRIDTVHEHIARLRLVQPTSSFANVLADPRADDAHAFTGQWRAKLAQRVELLPG
jgi:hypothetical protein